MATFYQRVFGLLPEMLQQRINPLEHSIESFVRSARPSGDGEVVLDAGAGESRFSKYFRDQFYLAMDSAVGDSAWNYSKIDVCGDLSAVPLKSRSVDLALNIQVLEHVAEPGTVLAELYRVLRPGGRLYLTAPQGWPEHQQPNDYFRFTQYSLRLLFRAAGFREVVIEPIGGYFHYLGHRLTYIPKVLFQDRRGLGRLLLFPVEVVVLLACCFVGPIACYYLDFLDKKKEFTLCYRCRATK